MTKYDYLPLDIIPIMLSGDGRNVCRSRNKWLNIAVCPVSTEVNDFPIYLNLDFFWGKSAITGIDIFRKLFKNLSTCAALWKYS